MTSRGYLGSSLLKSFSRAPRDSNILEFLELFRKILGSKTPEDFGEGETTKNLGDPRSRMMIYLSLWLFIRMLGGAYRAGMGFQIFLGFAD